MGYISGLEGTFGFKNLVRKRIGEGPGTLVTVLSQETMPKELSDYEFRQLFEPPVERYAPGG